MGELLRRRPLMAAASNAGPIAGGLLDQGALTFNTVHVTISGRNISGGKNTGSATDAYNKFRCVNLTDLNANVSEGLNITTDITGKPAVKTIPDGAVCKFSLVKNSSYYQASYAYSAFEIIDTSGATIKQIGEGKNAPASTASWTQSGDVDIACVALKVYHSSNAVGFDYDLSLTVDGEEWL